MTEDREQREENRCERSEVGRQRTEDRKEFGILKVGGIKRENWQKTE